MTNNPKNAPPIKIGIEEDSASFARVEQRTAETFARINSLAKANDTVAQSAQRLGQSLSDAFDLSRKSAAEYTQSLSVMHKQLDDVNNAGDRAQKNTSGGLRIEGLRRTGGALSQLGAGEAGGALRTVGDIAQIGEEASNLIEQLGPLAPVMTGVAGAALGLEIGFKLLDAQLADVKRGFQSALDTQKSYYEFAAKATTKDAENRKHELENTSRAQQKALDETNAAIKSEEQQTGLSFEALKHAGGPLGDLAQSLSKAWDEDTKALGDTNAAIGRLTGGLQSNAFAANDATAAQEKLADAYGKTVNEQIRLTREGNQLIVSGTKKQVEERIKTLSSEQDQLRSALRSFPEALLQTAKGQEIYTQLAERLKIVNGELVYLKENVKGLVDIKDFFGNLKKEADRITKEVGDRNARVASVQQKYEDDTARIEEQSLQKRADIEKQYAAKQVEIARQAADAAQAALAKFTQAREDLATTLDRDEQKAERDAAYKRLDIQIAGAREETKAYQEHVRELEQIRKDASARETEFLVTRNFQGLYLSRLQTSRDIDRSNERFGAGQQDRATSRQQQVEDLQRTIQREREARLIAYKEQLADAQKAYQRELQAVQQKRIAELNLARQAEQAALREAQQAGVNELRIRKNTYDRELQMAALYGAAYVKANDQIMQALINRAEQRLGQITGASGGATNTIIGGDTRRLLQRAGGGSLGAGQTAVVNERRRESFNGVPFPLGMGIFTALQSGNVSPGKSTGPITLNVYPSPGMDEERLAHKVLDKLEEVIGPNR